MLNLLISGCNGYMGRVVTAFVEADPDVKIVAGIDIITKQLADYPVFYGFSEMLTDTVSVISKIDAIVDFSAPSALEGLLKYSVSKNVPLVLCATGYSAEQIDSIENASRKVAIFRSGNMSVGINLLIDLVKRACGVLGEDFDVEIVERHHSRKVDAPSGTALMLADAASTALPYDPEYVYERKSKRNPREKCEIGISSVRGGTIVGAHEVIFAGQDEVLELRHSAASRDVFAAGALRAAKFIAGKPPGLYSMRDVLER